MPERTYQGIDVEKLARAVENGLAEIQALRDEIKKEAWTREDRDHMKMLLEQDRRTRWLWSTARAWAVWIAAVVAGATVGLDTLKTILKRLIS